MKATIAAAVMFEKHRKTRLFFAREHDVRRNVYGLNTVNVRRALTVTERAARDHREPLFHWIMLMAKEVSRREHAA